MAAFLIDADCHLTTAVCCWADQNLRSATLHHVTGSKRVCIDGVETHEGKAEAILIAIGWNFEAMLFHTIWRGHAEIIEFDPKGPCDWF